MPRSGGPKARGLAAKVRTKRPWASLRCQFFSSSCRSSWKTFAKLNGKLTMVAVHSTPRRQCRPAFLTARYSSFSAASLGKLPRILMILRSDRCSVSTACCRSSCGRRGRTRRTARHAPGPSPRLADRRIALAPFGLQLLKPNERHIGVLGPVDRLDGGQDFLAVLPGHERQAVPDQVQSDAGLPMVCGNTDVIASGKPLSPSTTATRMSLISPVTQPKANSRPPLARCKRAISAAWSADASVA